MQKRHSDPTPRQHWSPEEKAANIARIDGMQAFLTSQEPEFEAALRQHGYGSEGLSEVCARHKAELREFIEG